MKKFELVFIAGCQRSGTTLVGQMLGAHPNALLIDENDGVAALIDELLVEKQVSETQLKKCLASAKKNYQRLEERFDADGELLPNVTHLILKAPNATFFAEQLRDIEWPVRVLFPVRDARDVVCSMQRLSHIPMLQNQLRLISGSPTLKDRFRNEIELLSDHRIADHIKFALVWRCKNELLSEFRPAPLNALSFRYEDLIDDTESWQKRICAHAQLPTPEKPLVHDQVLKGVGPGLTARFRPVDAFSKQRWQRQMTSEIENDVWAYVGELMEEMGYKRQPEHDATSDVSVEPEHLDSPIVAFGRGGSGTRMLSSLLQTLGVFLGNKLNPTEDSIEWVDLIYEIAIKQNTPDFAVEADSWRTELRSRAAGILSKAGHQSGNWGWKLPETSLILPEVLNAFPKSRYVYFVRHPVAASLRKVHMTSNLTTSVGSTTLAAAYQFLGWTQDPASDDEHIRNVASWCYQIDLYQKMKDRLKADQLCELRYEDVCAKPHEALAQLAEFLTVDIAGRVPSFKTDVKRMTHWETSDSQAQEVWQVSAKYAERFGYTF